MHLYSDRKAPCRLAKPERAMKALALADFTDKQCVSAQVQSSMQYSLLFLQFMHPCVLALIVNLLYILGPVSTMCDCHLASFLHPSCENDLDMILFKWEILIG